MNQTAEVAVDSLVAEVEGRTLCDRIRYRLQRAGTDMTAPGLHENLGRPGPIQYVLWALDAHVSHGSVIRHQVGPRPLYRWNTDRAFTDTDNIAIEQVFREKLKTTPAPEKTEPVAAASPPDPLARAANAKVAAASSAAAPRHKTHLGESTMRARILRLLKPRETISRQSLIDGLGKGTNAGSATTMINIMRREGDILEVSSGRYMLAEEDVPVPRIAPVRAAASPKPVAMPEPGPQAAPAVPAPEPEPAPVVPSPPPAAAIAQPDFPGVVIATISRAEAGEAGACAYTAFKLGFKVHMELRNGLLCIIATSVPRGTKSADCRKSTADISANEQ